MGRLAISLLCALACHGLLFFLPIAEQGSVLPRLPGETSITIHLTAAAPVEKVPVSPPMHQDAERQPAKPVLIKPVKKKKRLSRVGAQKPVPLQPAESRPAELSSLSSSPGDRNGGRAPTMVMATPLYQSNPKPVYPFLARRRSQQGTVMLQVVVSENGRVKRVTVYQSSGFVLLDNAARDTVKNWQFVPGTENGHPVTTKVFVPVHFKLQ